LLTDSGAQCGPSYVIICTLEGATVDQLITQPHYCTETIHITKDINTYNFNNKINISNNDKNNHNT